MRIGTRLIMAAATLFFTGCVAMFSGLIFDVPNGEVKAKGKTLSVVAAFDSDITMAVVESMTKSLAKASNFRVLPAASARQRIPNYPPSIKGPYKSAHMTVDEDFSQTDMKKVKQIMKSVDTDYVYIIWVPTGYSRTSSGQGFGTSGEAKVYSAVAQMFQGPNARVVGQGKFTVTSSKVMPGAKVSDKEIQKAIHNTTETVAKIIAGRTGTMKQ